MLNEFERRFLEVAQNHLNLREAAAAVGSDLLPEEFDYALTIGSAASPLVSGITQQGIIAIQADAWFVLQYVSTAVILPAGSTFGDLSQFTPSANILLQITDTGAGEEIYSLPSNMVGFPGVLTTGCPVQNSCGIPFIYPTPRLIPPRTNIKIEATQLGTTALVNPQPVGFYIVLSGARVPVLGS